MYQFFLKSSVITMIIFISMKKYIKNINKMIAKPSKIDIILYDESLKADKSAPSKIKLS